MSYSYFLSWESPCADGLLWATLASASFRESKLILIDEMEEGITFTFDKEIPQNYIMSLLMRGLATETIYTSGDNISNDLAGQDV